MAFQYDANGQRVKKTVNGAATTYWRDTDGKIVRMQKGSDVLLFLYEGDGRRVGFLLNGVGYYYVYNAQGDVVGLIDKNGTQVVSYVYDAWGRAVSVTGSSAATAGALNPFRYRGYEYDTESGLYYLNSRYYDPMTMRFVNADRVAGVNQDMATYNLFVYCGNNPISRFDSMGYSWWDDFKSGVSNAWNSFTGWLGDTFGTQTTSTVVEFESKKVTNLGFAKVTTSNTRSYEITKGEPKPIIAYADTTNKKGGIKASVGSVSGNIGTGLDGLLSEKASIKKGDYTHSLGFKEKIITAEYTYSVSHNNDTVSYTLEINKLTLALAIIAPALGPAGSGGQIIEIFS